MNSKNLSIILVSTCLLLSAIYGEPYSIASPLEIKVGDGLRVKKHIKTFKDIRDVNLVKQTLDYSCGAASLATVLTYGLGDKVSEEDILKNILDALPKDEETLRKKQGFSLLDLKGAAESRGYKAQGFRLSPEYLSKLHGPVIVFIRPKDYKHFAVLKGVRYDRVYLADPSLGNVRMPVYKFLDMWLDENGKGIIFVVERKDSYWAEDYPLKLQVDGLPRPEILSIRQMLEIGNSHLLR